MPIAAYRSFVAEELRYNRPESDEEEGVVFDPYEASAQLRMQQATHGCGLGEMFVGVYNYFGLVEAGADQGILVSLGSLGVLLLSRTAEANAASDYNATYAHEFGHAKGLGHFACPEYPDPGYLDEAYPYPDAELGPARGWHSGARRFIDRGTALTHGNHSGEPHDIMSYCRPRFVSDFSYQQVLTYMQAPFFQERMEHTRACMAQRDAPAGSHRSLAVLGEVRADGGVSIRDMRVSDQPPWPAPSPSGTPLGAIELLDSGGVVTHSTRFPIPLHVPEPDQALWCWRIAYPEEATRVLVRGPSGEQRANAAIDCPRCGASWRVR